jgi:rhamnosyltransferase subunit B
MGTVILMTQGTGGDLYPFMQIGRGLRSRGHQVTFITEPKFEAEVRRAGFEFASMIQPGHVEPTEDDVVVDRQPQDGSIINPRILRACMYVYNTIKERRGPGPTVLIGHYNLNIIGQMAAELLGLPYVTIFTAPYFLMKMPVIEQVYVSEGDILNEYRTYLGLRPVRDWREWLKEPRWIMGLWPEWFAPNDPDCMFDDVRPVGFVYDPGIETGGLPQEAEDFLAGGGPTVLITHGTSKPYKIDFFSASAEACTTLGLKALLVTKFPELVPSGLPDNVLWCKYLPFASAMPRMDAIIHHGGMGTTNQSLTAGVPQLVLGYGYDRPDNGMRVQKLRVGEYLPSIRWRPGPVAESLRRIMTPEVRKRCRDLALRQESAVDPAAVACDVIESSIRETNRFGAHGA